MSFVITGNPGVGKHTIAQKIAEAQDLEIIDLNEIAKQYKISEKSKETDDVDVQRLKNILKDKISKKSLIVGHLAPYVLDKTQVKMAVILRKNPYKLQYIYKKRKYSKEKILDNQASEVLGIIAYDTMTRFGSKKTIQVDTTDRTIRDTVNVVKKALQGENPKDTIDWLALVAKKNDMERFFPIN